MSGLYTGGLTWVVSGRGHGRWHLFDRPIHAGMAVTLCYGGERVPARFESRNGGATLTLHVYVAGCDFSTVLAMLQTDGKSPQLRPIVLRVVELDWHTDYDCDDAGGVE